MTQDDRNIMGWSESFSERNVLIVCLCNWLCANAKLNLEMLVLTKTGNCNTRPLRTLGIGRNFISDIWLQKRCKMHMVLLHLRPSISKNANLWWPLSHKQKGVNLGLVWWGIVHFKIIMYFTVFFYSMTILQSILIIFLHLRKKADNLI